MAITPVRIPPSVTTFSQTAALRQGVQSFVVSTVAINGDATSGRAAATGVAAHRVRRNLAETVVVQHGFAYGDVSGIQPWW